MLAKSRIIIFTMVTICMMIPIANAGTLNDIPLVWKPTDNISEMEYIDISYLKKHQIRVNNFSDHRENMNEIGRNTEKETK